MIHERVLHEWRRLAGCMLSSHSLHRIHQADVNSIPFVFKRRRASSVLAEMLGNFYLQLQGSDSMVLTSKEWIRWERACDQAISRVLVVQDNATILANFSGLIRRYLNGSSLRQILVSSDVSLDQKLECVGWAINALEELHQLKADWSVEVHQSISHGDATIRNVIIDRELSCAQWIDFDMRHQIHLEATDRQADDIRALIFSAASVLPCSCYVRLAKIAFDSSISPSVLRRCVERLHGDWRRFSTFQLAQAPLPWRNARMISMALTAERGSF